MEELKINATAKTPEVDFNHLTGELVLTGISIPENSAKLYEGVFKWINEYVKNPSLLTNFRMNLEYFNTSSIMWISRMFNVLSSIKKVDATLMIHLYYDILEFETMDADELADAICPITNNLVKDSIINIGIKIYGTGSNGQILKEAIVFV